MITLMQASIAIPRGLQESHELSGYAIWEFPKIRGGPL